MRRISDFEQSLYDVLRDFQDGTIATNSERAGVLTEELTAVYDKVRGAAKKLTEK